MPRHSTAKSLNAWMNGELVGTWTVTPARGHEFKYCSDWLRSENHRPISLSLPLRPPDDPYRGEPVSAYFENLLPESKAIRDRLRARYSINSTSPFDLLAQIGRDCVGAIQLLAPDKQPDGYDRIECEALSETRVAKLLQNVITAGGDAEDDDFRVSIAGAQEKTALLWNGRKWCKPHGSTPTTHIFKLPLGVAPSGVDLTTSVENEYFCGRILAGFDLPVAKSHIERFKDKKVLVVERFDRKPSANAKWIMRLPQEDFAQVTATPPDAKYESDGGPGIKTIMQILRGSTEPEKDRYRFFKSQVVFWLLCAIDGHSKNFSLFIEKEGRFRLTPLYDVLSAYPVLGGAAGKIAPKKAKMAMAVWGENRHYRWAEIRRSHFERTAKDCGLSTTDTRTIIDEVIGTMPKVVDAVGDDVALAGDDVGGPILKGMREAVARLARNA